MKPYNFNKKKYYLIKIFSQLILFNMNIKIISNIKAYQQKKKNKEITENEIKKRII